MLNLNKYFFYIYQFLFKAIKNFSFIKMIANMIKFLICLKNLDFSSAIACFYQNNKKIKHVSMDLTLNSYDTVTNKDCSITKYELHTTGFNSENQQQLELLLQNVVKDISMNYVPPEYVWFNEHTEVKYFNLIKVSGEDGACALASIYKIVGSNEVGAIARTKAVQQLKDNITNSLIRELVKSEIRGVLLSNELIGLSIYNNLITNEEYKLILNLKDYRNRFIQLGDNLKVKYFGHEDLPINAQNISYARLFLKNFLDDYCNITIQEKHQLAKLEQIIYNANMNLENLVESRLLFYIDDIVSKSGFWLGVAGQSSGVMGAVAQINRVNFRVLSNNGNFYNNMQEITNICQHISIPNNPINNIYLHANADQIGVQSLSFHFDLLKETVLHEPPSKLYLITIPTIMKKKFNVENEYSNSTIIENVSIKKTESDQIDIPKNISLNISKPSKLKRNNSFYL